MAQRTSEAVHLNERNGVLVSEAPLGSVLRTDGKLT